MEQKKEEKIQRTGARAPKRYSVHSVLKKDAEEFEKRSIKEGKSITPIMTYGGCIIYLKADISFIPHNPFLKLNYTPGNFEKWGAPNHKTIVLTPSHHSGIRRVEIEIQRKDNNSRWLLSDKIGR